MTARVTRFAPSPNGRLHLGHAYSALLNHEAARASGGVFHLRIEDIDRARCPRHLALAAMEDLHWLGLTWLEPVRFQSDFLGLYEDARRRLEALGLVYRCACTRAALAGRKDLQRRDPDGQPLYPSTCRERPPAAGPPVAWRLDMAKAMARIGRPLDWEEEGQGRVRAEPQAWGDLILARKDIGTSYHLAVVIDDAAQGITDVIRGRDLYHATAVHRLLQVILGLPEPRYRHHRLITGGDGRKLAKSAGDASLSDLRAAGVTAREVRAGLGMVE